MSFSAADHEFMARAMALTQNGRNSATPNPSVGCVVVKNARIIGEGWHEKAGQAHAEVNALKACSEDARGATVYVTLEPCAHHGRTPPCSASLIAAGVARVVAALKDPNPKVAGTGLAALQAARGSGQIRRKTRRVMLRKRQGSSRLKSDSQVADVSNSRRRTKAEPRQ